MVLVFLCCRCSVRVSISKGLGEIGAAKNATADPLCVVRTMQSTGAQSTESSRLHGTCFHGAVFCRRVFDDSEYHASGEQRATWRPRLPNFSFTLCLRRHLASLLHADADAWELGPSMSQRRCGLGVTAVPDGKVYAVGGYGGNLVYLNSAEVFPLFFCL